MSVRVARVGDALARAADGSRFRRGIRRAASRDRFAVVAALVLLASVLVALLAPWLPLLDPDTVDTPNRLRPPLTPGHRLGTDEFGRDLLARLVWGARVSLLAGVATAAAMVIGVTLGILGGFYTGWVETVVMRLTDILMAFPYILLAIAIVAGLGPGLRNAMIAIAIVGFPIYTRLARGTQPPTADWGSMLATARTFVILSPHVALLPGLAIFLVVLSLNVLGDALQDYLDPRMRHG